MNEEFRFNVSSVVVEDLAASGSVFDSIGAPEVWEGNHPFFQTRTAIHATGKGGVMLLQRASGAHPAVAGCASTRERNFHINLLVKDLFAQRTRAGASPHAGEPSAIYDGPCGRTFAVPLNITGGSEFWFEFTEGHANLIASAESAFECVDSTAMVASKRDDLIVPFGSLGLATDERAHDGYFDVLGAINAVVMLESWHYLEINEPTAPGGIMANFLTRKGRPGIFGVNLVPRDMQGFVEVACRNSVDTNTLEPVLLMVEVRGAHYKCAEIITINPRATGGGRVFILKPLEYPWQLVA
jgi:hypothetical protein